MERKTLYSTLLWDYGRSFINTAGDALRIYQKENPMSDLREPTLFPIYFNFLHGIELGLKSYLVHKTGMLEKELRQYGHRLDDLLAEALRHRLEQDCTKLTSTNLEVIRFLSKHYATKKFEYVWMGGSLEMLPIHMVHETANTLISSLQDVVGTPGAKEWAALPDSLKRSMRKEWKRDGGF